MELTTDATGMLKKMLSSTHRTILFLAFLLASVAAEEDFPSNDFDYEALPLKEKCPEYLDNFLCRYWRTFKEDGSSLSKVESLDEFLPENRPEKRFTVFRRQHPVAQGYKRGPGFRSWGGKRDYPLQEKRNKFASWGGKRDGEQDGIESEKRNKFASWGGKRDTEATPRSTFQSWGGKRDAETPISYDQLEKRGPLWNYRSLYPSESFKKHLPKRPQFQSWGGKRTSYPFTEFLQLYSHVPRSKLIYTGEKRKFSSWGGKRSGDPDKQIDGDPFKRHTFQNWGGKRNPSDDDNDDDDDDWTRDISKDPSQRNKRRVVKNNPENVESHSGFNSWGGKRGDDSDDTSR